MIKMKGPRDVSMTFVGGKEYAVKNGVVEVPDDAAPALARHGFHEVQEERATRSELHLNRKGQ